MMAVDRDQVSLIHAALNDFLRSADPKTGEFSCLMRIMEALELRFVDREAALNALYWFPQFNALRGIE